MVFQERLLFKKIGFKRLLFKRFGFNAKRLFNRFGFCELDSCSNILAMDSKLDFCAKKIGFKARLSPNIFEYKQALLPNQNVLTYTILDSKHDFCSNILGSKQEFRSSILNYKQELWIRSKSKQTKLSGFRSKTFVVSLTSRLLLKKKMVSKDFCSNVWSQG